MATTSACAAPPGCGGRERGAQAWPRPHPPSPAHRKPRPPAAGAAARTEPQTPGQTDGRALGGSAISPVSAMAEPAAQAPLLSSAAASGPCGGSGPAFCADPPKSSSSSSSVSLSVAAPGLGAPPPDSPESPFELVPPGPPFWADREVLSQIPEDRICHFPPAGGAGRIQSGSAGGAGRIQSGPGRLKLGTTAALEEVSKCVREMHQFTAQFLHWDALGDDGDVVGSGTHGVVGSVTSATPCDPGEGPPPRPTGDTVVAPPPPEPRDPPHPAPLPRLPAVRDVLLWRPPGRSGALLALSALLLLSLSACSAVAVLAHAALALLSVTISLRVYRGLLAALQRAPDAHPFRAYLDLDLTLTPERFEAVAVGAARQLDRGLRRLLRLLLVHDLLDSLKLAVTMWLLTYVGAVFNGITLLILAELLAFTLPPLYEKYKVQIDHSMGVARQQIDDVVAKVHAKLPFLAKKPPQ
ncbi:uncharacterized protein [Patagioenas fasciata]|uniref:uncharacterized protein isoform X1 n=1 Tax=Patagioenas fasciata TaxID=372321 RepID=UPI003A99F16E